MDIFDLLTLISGLSLFLYGMNVMSASLKKSAGNRLKIILGNLTSNPFKGFLLGLGVTAIIQSSSATTVMVVGFVNSGTMLLSQAIGVIMGANLGAAVTTWLTALSGIGNNGEDVSVILKWLKPGSWMPILALIGIIMIMFSKHTRKKDLGHVLLGFAVLMVGMEVMSGSVAGLKESESFKSILTLFESPVLGVLTGTLITAMIQSSAASVGILQSLTTTGAITFGAAIPIIVGQNIGTCATAMLSSIGANKNGRRAALIHLYFNLIGAVIFLVPFYIINAISPFGFMSGPINMWWVAGIHTLFKIYCIVVITPFSKYLEKLSVVSVKEKKDENETANLLDERLINTPSVAIERCEEVAHKMAEVSRDALLDALTLFDEYDEKKAMNIRKLEDTVDVYEDMLGSYLVKLSAKVEAENDTREVTKLLHIIGDLERISDHAVNFAESAEEMKDKKLTFSDEAVYELSVMRNAVTEILGLATECFLKSDIAIAARVEPLEDVVDGLRDQIKRNHIIRVQKNACSIEQGFVLSDILTDFERVSDHCSNIAGCVIEIAHNALDVHHYTHALKGNEAFERASGEYREKYSLSH